MKLNPRDTQTEVKHQILSSYLDRWGGIILNPTTLLHAKQQIDKGRGSDLHLVYVDCFSYVGRYAGDKHRSEGIIYGSPVLGIHSLDKLAEWAKKDGLGIRVNAILIEKSPEMFKGLLETLSIAQLSHRVRKTLHFSQLQPGEIAVVNGDSTTLVNDLVGYTTSGRTWAFYLLDPWGADIPHDFVKTIVSQKHHDVMINFMYEDLIRKGGMTRSSKIGPQQRQQIDNWTDVFGGETWKDIEYQARYGTASQSSEEETSKRVERALVEHYRNVLQEMDPQLTIKLVDLQFSERKRTIFYLFLTTHDPTGALALNKTLYEAKLFEHEVHYLQWFAKKTAPPPHQLKLKLPPEFEQPTVPELAAPSRPTTDEIAQEVLIRFHGQTVTRRDVYRGLADDIFFSDEVDKALRHLRKKGDAKFDGNLTHSTFITFADR